MTLPLKTHCKASLFNYPTVFLVFNLLWYQLLWWLAVLYPQQSTALLLMMLISHFMLSRAKKSDLKHLFIAFIGCGVDQILLNVGLIYPERHFIPWNLVLVWVMLAWCFCYSLGFLKRLHLTWLILLGATSGPISYYSALQFSSISTPYSDAVFVVCYGLVWSLLLPFLVTVSRYLDNVSHLSLGSER